MNQRRGKSSPDGRDDERREGRQKKKKRSWLSEKFQRLFDGNSAGEGSDLCFLCSRHSSVFPSQQLKVWYHRAADLLFMLQLISVNGRHDWPTAERRCRGAHGSRRIVLSTLRNQKNFERILFSWMLDFTFTFFVVLKVTFVTVRCGRLCLKNSG